MKTHKKAEEARRKLIEAGAKCEKKEDREGKTRSGWWMDSVFLATKPEDAWRELGICE